MSLKNISGLLILLCMFQSLQTNEFIRATKTKKVSLNKIKEQAAQEFILQLRLAAETVQRIGTLQVTYQQCVEKSAIDTYFITLQETGMRLYRCRLQYADLFAAVPAQVQNPFAQKDIAPLILCGYLLETLGILQQHILTFLQDIFDDTGCVFTKQQASKLSEVVKVITLYTNDFKDMHNLLPELESRMRGPLKKPAGDKMKLTDSATNL